MLSLNRRGNIHDCKEGLKLTIYGWFTYVCIFIGLFNDISLQSQVCRIRPLLFQWQEFHIIQHFLICEDSNKTWAQSLLSSGLLWLQRKEPHVGLSYIWRLHLHWLLSCSPGPWSAPHFCAVHSAWHQLDMATAEEHAAWRQHQCCELYNNESSDDGNNNDSDSN